MFAMIRRSLLPRLQVRAFSVPTRSPVCYGVADFGKVRREEGWYVDNTRFLPVLEVTGRSLFFVRPPRFGKTLFLSMMKHYYDVSGADEFDNLFSGLWIHNKPTDLRSSYHVLHLDFGISIDGDISANLTDCINCSIYQCCCDYGLSSGDVVNNENALASLRRLAHKFKGKNFMVLVDEYDRFANELMLGNPEAYDKVIKRKGDDRASPLRSFMTCLKSLPSVVSLADFRTFITGITPLVLADTSGYNVAKNISLDEKFGDMVGFHENDINEALHKYLHLNNEERSKVLNVMRSHYDGYLFIGCEKRLYNSTLASFFVDKMILEPEFKDYILTSKSIEPDSLVDENTKYIDPRRLVDRNTKISDRVLNVVSRVPSSSNIIYRLSNEDLDTTVAEIHEDFSLHEMLHPPEDDVNAHDRVLSFLFYHGIVTMKRKQLQYGPISLQLPNKLAELDFLPRLRNVLSLPEKLLLDFQDHPSEETLGSLLSGIIERQQSLFDNYLSEGGLQHMIEASLRAQFCGRSVLEAEVSIAGSGRPDLVIQFSHCTVVIELKRIRLNALVASDRLRSEWPKRPKHRDNWRPEEMKSLTDVLKRQTIDELVDLKIESSRQDNYGGKETVCEVMKGGCSQVKKYAFEVVKAAPEIPCYAFVAVQVGFPFVVKQVPLD